jgi:hypothetical protein
MNFRKVADIFFIKICVSLLFIHLVATSSQENAYISGMVYGLHKTHYQNENLFKLSRTPTSDELWRRAYEIEQHMQLQHAQAEAAWQQHCNDLGQQGYDSDWCSSVARYVETRCTVINFTNTDLKRLIIPPSRLPNNFKDIFEIQEWWGKRAYLHAFDVNDFREAFTENISCSWHEVFCVNPSETIKAHMRAEMRNWGRYKHTEFCIMLWSFPVYESYMFEIGAQLKHDKEFRDKVTSTRKEAAVYIKQEYDRIHDVRIRQAQEIEKNRLAREAHQQQCLREQEKQNFFKLCSTQDKVILEKHAVQWQQTNNKRFNAYQRMLADSRTESQEYLLNHETQKALHQAGMVGFKDGMHIVGHALQHELMREIIAGFDTWAALRFPLDEYLLHSSLHKDSAMLLENAYYANLMGSCGESAELIDLSTKIITYCKAALVGLCKGTYDGAESAIMGTVYMFAHPVDAAQGLCTLFHDIAVKIYPYLPPVPPDYGEPAEAWIDYNTRCERVNEQWSSAAHKIKHICKNITFSPEEVKQASYMVSNVTSNVLVGHGFSKIISTCATIAAKPIGQGYNISYNAILSTDLARKLLRNAHNISRAITKRIRHAKRRVTKLINRYFVPEEYRVVQAMGDIPLTYSREIAERVTLYEASPATHNPRMQPRKQKRLIPAQKAEDGLQQSHPSLKMRRKNYMKMSLSKVKKQIIKKAQQYNLSVEEINSFLKNFNDPRLDGCLRTFNHAIHELEHVKGARELMDDIFKYVAKSDLQRAKGHVYELQVALKLQEEGHAILEFSREVEIIDGLERKLVEFDIITNTNIIECKNLYFEKIPSNPEVARKDEKIIRLFKQCKNGVKCGMAYQKPYCIVFKTLIPSEFDWLRADLLRRGAQIIENFY